MQGKEYKRERPGREAAGARPEGPRLASEGRAKRGLHEPADLQAVIAPNTLRAEEWRGKEYHILKKSANVEKNEEK